MTLSLLNSTPLPVAITDVVISSPDPHLQVHPQPSTLNPQPSTLYPKHATLNPQPSTLNPQPRTLNPRPSSLNPQPPTLNPQPSTLQVIFKRGSGKIYIYISPFIFPFFFSFLPFLHTFDLFSTYFPLILTFSSHI